MHLDGYKCNWGVRSCTFNPAVVLPYSGYAAYKHARHKTQHRCSGMSVLQLHNTPNQMVGLNWKYWRKLLLKDADQLSNWKILTIRTVSKNILHSFKLVWFYIFIFIFIFYILYMFLVLYQPKSCFTICFISRRRSSRFRPNSNTELVIILRNCVLNNCLDKWSKTYFNSIHVKLYGGFTTPVWRVQCAKISVW